MNRRATKNLQQSLVFPTSQVFLFRARRTEEIPTHDYQRHDRWMSPVSRVRDKMGHSPCGGGLCESKI